jgi:hypothetical protein
MESNVYAHSKHDNLTIQLHKAILSPFNNFGPHLKESCGGVTAKALV